MQKRLSDGTLIPALGVGTWRFGGTLEADYSHDREEIALLTGLIEAGFRHIDTAEMYGAGHAEELVGAAIRGVPRNELFITGKVWRTHLHYQEVLRACEASLARLKCDFFDLYLIHQVDEAVPLEETLRAMTVLQERGLIRHIGVSNFALPRLKRAMALAPVCVNQVHYSLGVRAPEATGLLKFCQEHQIVLTAYRPLRGVKLEDFALREVAGHYQVTAANAALNWLLSQEQVTALVATHDIGHGVDNLRAGSWRMAPEFVAYLQRNYVDQGQKGAVELT